MEIIVISGKSGSGKDTFANMMRAKLEAAGCKCITAHFADLVKHFCTDYYQWNGDKSTPEGRRILQVLGTNKVRQKFPDYWAETIAKFLAAIPDDFDCAFVPDARFDNEIAVMKKYNPQAQIIRIERYNEDGSKYINPLLTLEQTQHPSETSLDDYEDWDYIVENHNLKELEESAETVLADLQLLA